MSEAYASLIEGLNDALTFARGEQTGAVVHQVEVPEVDVAAIRANTGLSQRAFARSIGLAKGTLLNCEHGRRRPACPAQVLLESSWRVPGEFRGYSSGSSEGTIRTITGGPGPARAACRRPCRRSRSRALTGWLPGFAATERFTRTMAA